MLGLFFAEREGFEPPVHCCTLVFKTSAFDHSAISPKESQKYKYFQNIGRFINYFLPELPINIF